MSRVWYFDGDEAREPDHQWSVQVVGIGILAWLRGLRYCDRS